MRSLARSLLARMDEAKDIRITNGEVKHRQSATIRRWKVLAQGGALSKRRASVPFGTVPDSAFNINREGEWAQCCDDPKALDGQAISISTARSGWTVTFDLDNVTFRPNKNYTLKVRARVSKKPGTYGNAFWAGVYSNEEKKGRGQITVKAEAVSDDGYQWYDVITWVPGRNEYFWIGVGPFDTKIGSPVEGVWVDEILIEENQDAHDN